MKNLIYIFCIIIVLFKTGNVLSNSNLFSVNNIEIESKKIKNKENLVNRAFKKGFNELTDRLLLKEDFKKISTTNLDQIKKLISHYQIISPNFKEDNQNFNVNIYFDKEKIHNFFYENNILYSDVLDIEVMLFPLLEENKQFFFYTKNYFYNNWNKNESEEAIQYVLPAETLENIRQIEINKENILKLDLVNFFKEYENENKVFAIIQLDDDTAKVFLNSIISGKKLNKNLFVKREGKKKEIFYNNIINEIKNTLKDMIKSQNLIDVRTPSFLNVKLKLEKNNNLFEFEKRLTNIDLVENYFIQKLNKDYVLIKIKYHGKISKIMSKLNTQKIKLKKADGEWQINLN